MGSSSSDNGSFAAKLADAAQEQASATGPGTPQPQTQTHLLHSPPPMLRTPHPHEDDDTADEDGKPISPSERIRNSSQAMLNEMAAFLQRHPSMAESLRDKVWPSSSCRMCMCGACLCACVDVWTRSICPGLTERRVMMMMLPPLCSQMSPSKQWGNGAPARGLVRKYGRYAFRVLVALMLLLITRRLHQLQLIERERQLAEAAANRHATQLAVRTAVAGNFALMALNVFLAVRGVQIWHLLQRVGFEGWIHTIAYHAPWTRRVARVMNVATMPVRHALRPLRMPLRPIGQWRAQAALRAQLEREAARRAAHPGLFTYSVRKGLSLMQKAKREAWGVFSFVDRKVRSPLYGLLFRPGA